MRGFDQLLGELALDAGDADVEARAEEEGAAGPIEIDLRVDLGLARKLDLALSGGELDRADVASRPGRREQVFGGRGAVAAA